jgi:hypothetical protein
MSQRCPLGDYLLIVYLEKFWKKSQQYFKIQYTIRLRFMLNIAKTLSFSDLFKNFWKQILYNDFQSVYKFFLFM